MIPRDISRSSLFLQLDNLVEVEGITQEQIVLMKASLLEITRIALPEWEKIRSAFPQYTDHSLQHLVNILNLVERILPKEESKDGTKRVRINALELVILIAAILLHDIGMAVSPAEKEAARSGQGFQHLRRQMADRIEAAEHAKKAGDLATALAIEDAILVEYFRRIHAARSAHFIRSLEGKARLQYADVDICDLVAKVAESHAWPVSGGSPGQSLLDLDQDELIGDVRVNMQFLAFCLRLADILDFDRSRAPSFLFQRLHRSHAGFTESKSIEEWRKHLSITGWKVGKHHVVYRAKCDSPEILIAVHQFLDWVDKELEAYHQVLRHWKKKDQRRYGLKLTLKVDRKEVKMANEDQIAGEFRFNLDFGRIMSLLMDRSLYPDPALFLRELLQNSLDACRLQTARAEKAGMGDKYKASIAVYDYTMDTQNPRIIFQDNGVGMSLDKVKRYFLQVGRSFYQSFEFMKEREELAERGILLDTCSRFGIGFLSCFLGGDRIEVKTYDYQSEPLQVSIYGPDKYFLIERLKSPPGGIPYQSAQSDLESEPLSHAGTKVTVYLRPGWRDASKPRLVSNHGERSKGLIFDVLNFFAMNHEYELSVITDGIAHLIPPMRAERTHHDNLHSMVYRGSRKVKLQVVESNLLKAYEIDLDRSEPELKGLRGRAHILLLNDGQRFKLNDGKISMNFELLAGSGFNYDYKMGFRMDNLILKITSLIEREFYFIFYNSFGVRRFVDFVGMQMLESLLDSPSAIADHLRDYLSKIAKLDNKKDIDSSRLVDLIKSLEKWGEIEKRKGLKLLIDFFAKPASAENRRDVDGLVWHSSEMVLSQMATLDPLQFAQWVLSSHRKISFDSPGEIGANCGLSLFGITLPFGVIDWNPLEPHAGKQYQFLPPGVYAFVDARGKAPVPAPHRLSCAIELSRPMITTFHRILIREILNIYEPNKGDPAWNMWFKGYMSYFSRFWPKSFFAEWPIIRKYLHFPFMGRRGEITFLSMDDLLGIDKGKVAIRAYKSQIGVFLSDLMLPKEEVFQEKEGYFVNLKSWVERNSSTPDW